jgi:Flp pilus assembly protein TadG
MIFSRRLVRRLRDARGANLVEAAIITPLLLLLTFAIIDFATIFYLYLALENGISQATRYAVTGQLMDDPGNPGTPLSREASIKAAMRQATPTITLSDSAFTFSHMAPGGASWSGGTGQPGDLEKVTVDYTWTVLTPFLWPFFNNGQIHISVDSPMKNEPRFQ